MKIKVFTSSVSQKDLLELAQDSYGDMVKGVVDVHRRTLALGGELHADAEQILLDRGSRQEDLWGFNIFIGKNREEYLQYHSMINIRPRQGNRSPVIQDRHLKDQIKEIIDSMVSE